MPEDKRRVLRQQVEEHILAGRIRPSKSAWASRAFLVSKKDAKTLDEWRMVVDYGPLNLVAKKYPFPSPDTDRIISNMSGAKYFSCMDINKAFHQIPCADESTIEKTAFVTPDGLYEWTVMPMGVANGPAVQQSLMHKVFGDLIGYGMDVFIDDIIVYSKNDLDHNNMIKTILQRLREYNIILKGSKSYFAQAELAFLGFIMGEEGIKPDLTKIDAITTMAAPFDIRSLQMVLGTFQFYARFIKDYATACKPLTTLLKKGIDWKWGTTEQEAFDQIKEAFKDPLLLVP